MQKNHCKLQIGFLFVFMLLVLTYSAPRELPALASAVFLHELGHVIAARLCKIKLRKLKLSVFGASILPNETLFSYRQEIFLCLGGPAMNLITAFILNSLFPFEEAHLFAVYSYFLAALNLLPVKDFDGGRIFYAILCFILSPNTSELIIKVSSFIIIFALWTLSTYLLITVSASLTLFVFSLSLFAKIFISVS